MERIRRNVNEGIKEIREKEEVEANQKALALALAAQYLPKNAKDVLNLRATSKKVKEALDLQNALSIAPQHSLSLRLQKAKFLEVFSNLPANTTIDDFQTKFLDFFNYLLKNKQKIHAFKLLNIYTSALLQLPEYKKIAPKLQSVQPPLHKVLLFCSYSYILNNGNLSSHQSLIINSLQTFLTSTDSESEVPESEIKLLDLLKNNPTTDLENNSSTFYNIFALLNLLSKDEPSIVIEFYDIAIHFVLNSPHLPHFHSIANTMKPHHFSHPLSKLLYVFHATNNSEDKLIQLLNLSLSPLVTSILKNKQLPSIDSNFPSDILVKISETIIKSLGFEPVLNPQKQIIIDNLMALLKKRLSNQEASALIFKYTEEYRLAHRHYFLDARHGDIYTIHLQRLIENISKTFYPILSSKPLKLLNIYSYVTTFFSYTTDLWNSSLYASNEVPPLSSLPFPPTDLSSFQDDPSIKDLFNDFSLQANLFTSTHPEDSRAYLQEFKNFLLNNPFIQQLFSFLRNRQPLHALALLDAYISHLLTLPEYQEKAKEMIDLELDPLSRALYFCAYSKTPLQPSTHLHLLLVFLYKAAMSSHGTSLDHETAFFDFPVQFNLPTDVLINTFANIKNYCFPINTEYRILYCFPNNINFDTPNDNYLFLLYFFEPFSRKLSPKDLLSLCSQLIDYPSSITEQPTLHNIKEYSPNHILLHGIINCSPFLYFLKNTNLLPFYLNSF